MGRGPGRGGRRFVDKRYALGLGGRKWFRGVTAAAVGANLNSRTAGSYFTYETLGLSTVRP